MSLPFRNPRVQYLPLVCPNFPRYILPCPHRTLGPDGIEGELDMERELEWRDLGELFLLYLVNCGLIGLLQWAALVA